MTQESKMIKQIHTLHNDGSGKELTQYIQNVSSIESIYSCVVENTAESNIYKITASFENAGIVPASEVPTGTHSDKLSFLLAKAIEQMTPCVHENMQLAGKAAKRWSEHVVIENQQEKLNSAIGKLLAPVKNAGIPSYSELTSSQRELVQKVFQRTLKKSEPVEINLITEAIDRYNAGANLGVMFKALNLKLDYSNGIALYEQESYDQLMSDEMFAYLFTRWESYQKMTTAIGQHKYLTPTTLGAILDTTRSTKSIQMSSQIHKALVNVGFDKAVSEYNSNSKTTTEYEDVKPYISGENVVKPLSVNNRNRLAGLSKMISELQEVPVYRVDETKTDMDNDAILNCLMIYYEVIEEVTNNLMAFIFLTQTTIRNSTVTQDVITSIEMVDKTITELFENVKNSAVEDGTVSQEGFKELLGKLKTRVVKSLPNRFSSNEVKAAFNKLVVDYNETANSLFKLKLRDSTSLNEEHLNTFKKTHEKNIKDLFDVNISGMDIDDLFSFMTNGIFTADLNKDLATPLSCALHDTRNVNSVELIKVLNNEPAMVKLLHKPYYDDLSFYTISTEAAASSEDTYYSLFRRDITSLPEFYETTYAFAMNGTMFTELNNDCKTIFGSLELDYVPKVTFKHPQTNEITQIGYGQMTSTSLNSLIALFAPVSKTKVNLNTIKNSDSLIPYCQNEIQYSKYDSNIQEYYADKHAHPTVVSAIDYAVDSLTAAQTVIKDLPDISKGELTQSISLMNYMITDLESSVIDCDARMNLAKIIAVSSAQSADSIRHLYITFNEIAKDFINLAK